MKYDPAMLPQFIAQLEQATSMQEIQKACQDIKEAVQERWANENTRRKPMSEIRKKVRERFPINLTNDEKAQFPYFFTSTGKGHVSRWEHLAINYLREDWNHQTDWSDKVEKKVVKSESENTQMVETNLDILSYVELDGEELEVVNLAIGDADIKEWVKQAMLQRANAINALRSRIEEDLSEVPSEVLMNDKKYRTNPAAARELVGRAARVVKQWNLDHPSQKWCLTNKILGELTGVTVKAIAKNVLGMDIESYNQSQGLEPLLNRFTKAAVGNPSEVMSLVKVTGVEGTEKDYTPQAVVEAPIKTIETKKKVKSLPANGTSTIDIQDFLKSNPDYVVRLKGEGRSVTYDRMNNEKGVFIGMKCLESGEEIKEI